MAAALAARCSAAAAAASAAELLALGGGWGIRMSIRGLGGWVTPPVPAWDLDALPPERAEPFEFEFGFEFGFEKVESTEFRLEFDLELDLEFDLEFGLERFFLRSSGLSFNWPVTLFLRSFDSKLFTCSFVLVGVAPLSAAPPGVGSLALRSRPPELKLELEF